MNKAYATRGFTMIELLIIIAIIGVLSLLSIGAVQSARVAARDSKRLADARQIQAALELLYSQTGGPYPVNSSIILGETNTRCLSMEHGFTDMGNCSSPLMNSVPSDPRTYSYEYESEFGDSYLIRVTFEREYNGLYDIAEVTPQGVGFVDLDG